MYKKTEPILGIVVSSKNSSRYKHGLSNKGNPLHPIYVVWFKMMWRCHTGKTGKHWKNYGGRGIKVCKKWHDPVVFVSWALENGWKKGLEIDRKNVNGNYTPRNCHFVTRRQNLNNKRSTLKIKSGAKLVSLADLCDGSENKNYARIRLRYKRGITSKRDLLSPSRNERIREAIEKEFGEKLTFQQAVDKYGKVRIAAASDRFYKHGWNIREAICTPRTFDTHIHKRGNKSV